MRGRVATKLKFTYRIVGVDLQLIVTSLMRKCMRNIRIYSHCMKSTTARSYNPPCDHGLLPYIFD